MVLKFFTSMTRELKLKVKKGFGANWYVYRSTGEKLIKREGSNLAPHPE